MGHEVTRRTFGQTVAMAAVGNSLHGPDRPAPASGTSETPTGDAPDELCDLSAIELATRIRRKDVSAREVMAAHLARIERINPKVNAIVTLVAERALADAATGGRDSPLVAARSARCMDCRLPTRTSSTPPAFARRAVRFSTATMCRRTTR